ncbi:MAG TPA: dihydrofolate reductase [Clostridia bacterium]|jgi:dihydrofolate reductase|nr:dihydrofolate reductase [Clostridia bacterium]
MHIIVCVDKNWGIGKNNGLLFHIPADLRYFKNITRNKIVVMGGNTLLSLPKSKPLPNRINIVLTDVFTRDDCIIVPTLKELFYELKKYNTDDIFIIGGAMFYRTMLDYCESAYVTKVDATCDDATVFFPNLDEKLNWIHKEASDNQVDNGYNFVFTKYINTKIKEIEY